MGKGTPSSSHIWKLSYAEAEALDQEGPLRPPLWTERRSQARRQQAELEAQPPIEQDGVMVKGSQHFNPDPDVETIYKAMKGIGTKKQAIIDVLMKKSNAVRQQIVKSFKAQFSEGTRDDVSSFVDLGLALHDAQCLRSMRKLPTRALRTASRVRPTGHWRRPCSQWAASVHLTALLPELCSEGTHRPGWILPHPE